MSIVCFRFTGNADRLRVIATVTDNNNRPIGTECSCFLAPYPSELRTIDELEERAYINWLNGVKTSSPPIPMETNIPDSSQSGVPSLAFSEAPIPMETNNSSFIECKQLGDRKTQIFRQWMDTPPLLSNDSNAPSLENSTALQGALWQILSPKEYRENPSNHSFVIHTDTEDPKLNRRLQRLPFHSWGFIETYDNAEIAFSTTQHPISQPSNTLPRVFVILGDDATINLSPHEQAIKSSFSTFKDDPTFKEPVFWSSKGKEHPEQNLYETLNKSIQDKNSPTILIFVGHSSSNDIQGDASSQIYLNNQISISPTNRAFKNILQRLRENGLIFAAFFSCNGLNIAHQLNQAQIPYILVSRDRLPVHVALTSITQFLSHATQTGVSINVALQQVRQYLQENVETIQTDMGCPNASNLLVLFQNPVQNTYMLRPAETKHIGILVKLRQKIKKAVTKFLPTRNLRLLVMRIIFGIVLVFTIDLLWQIFHPTTACDDIPQTIDYISCGEKNLFPPKTDKKNSFPDSNTIKTNAKPEHFDTSWEKYMKNANFEAAIALSNAKNKIDGVPIKTIAVMLPLSDNLLKNVGYVPKGILSAIAQAQEQWNDKKGRWNLEVMLVNDHNGEGQDTNGIRSIVDQIIKNPKILGVISHYSSDTTAKVIDKYNDGHLTAISGSATATDFSKKSYFIRTTTTTDVQAENIINFINKKYPKIKNIQLISDDKSGVFIKSFQKSLQNFSKNLNSEITISDIKLLSDNDVIDLASFINSSFPKEKPKALFISPSPLYNKYTKTIEGILGGVKEKCPECLFIVTETGMDQTMLDFIKKRDNKENDISSQIVFSFPYYYGIDKVHSSEINSDEKEFKTDYLPKDLLGKLMTHRSYLIYDAIYLLLDAIDKGINSHKTDKEIRENLPKLIREMTKPEKKYFGMTGQITINKNNDRNEKLNGLLRLQFDGKEKAPRFVKAE